MPTTSADSSFTLTRELAEQLRRHGITAATGTHALVLGHAVVAVDIDGAPYVLSAVYDADQELSWSITDPAALSEHSTGTLNGATIEQAARHLAHVIAPYTPAAREPEQDPLRELLEALIDAGHDFQHWSSPTDPHEWLSMATADGGEITIEGGQARLPRNAASYTGLRAQYAPVAGEDFGDRAATLFVSPDLGRSCDDGPAGSAPTWAPW
ncbi:hypothetical protein [Kitasatospora sp. NPDC088134]|uniref:hypothetical protein n=1 Tax=Kitasatospora sp. NPDC088134 TaxID=3364071 RepID=UPI0038227A47